MRDKKLNQPQRLDSETPTLENIMSPRGPDYNKRRKDSLICTYNQNHTKVQKLRIKSLSVNIMILYGMGPHKLKKTLKITYEEAAEYIERFLTAYPGVRAWINQVHEDCMNNHVVWTYFGRPRRLEEIASAEKWIQARAMRQSVNSVIQGSAADVVLQAMICVETSKELQELGCKLLLQVHDELLFEIPEENAEQAKTIIKQLMEYEPDYFLKVPLPVDAHIGDNWGEVH